MKNKSKILVFNLLSIAIFLIVLGTSFVLFYKYANGILKSDFTLHYNASISGNGYSLIQFMFKLTNYLNPNKLYEPYLLTFLIALSIIFTTLIINYLSNLKFSLALIISSLLIFLCNIYIPYFWGNFYNLQTFATQPWHNTTYIIMRCFSLLTIYLFIILIKNKNSKQNILYWLCFFVSLFLTNFSKPNFYAYFCPAVIILLIYFYIIKEKTYKGFNILLISIVVLSSIILIYPALILYGGNDNSSIIIDIENITKHFSNWNLLFSIVSSYIFPVLAFWVLKKSRATNKFDNLILYFAWICVIISLFQFIILGETGPRANDGNFHWGVFNATYLLYVISISLIIKHIKKIKMLKNGLCILIILCFLLTINILSGIIYHIMINYLGVYYLAFL